MTSTEAGGAAAAAEAEPEADADAEAEAEPEADAEAEAEAEAGDEGAAAVERRRGAMEKRCCGLKASLAHLRDQERQRPLTPTSRSCC